MIHLDYYKKNTIAVISVRKRRPPGKPKHQLMQVICKNTDDHNHRKNQQNNNFSAVFLAVLHQETSLLPVKLSGSSGYNTDTKADMFSKRIMKNMKFYCPYKTRRPSDSQLQSDICAFSMHYIAFPDKSPRHNTFPDKYSYDTDLRDFS